MDAQPSSNDSTAHVTAAAVAANLRMLNVRLRDGQAARHALPARVHQIIELFIDKHWRAPRRYAPILPLSYMLSPGPYEATFAEDVAALTSQLERHLFGEGLEIKCLIGNATDIAAIAEGSEVCFIDAHEKAAEAAVAAEEAERQGKQSEEPASAARQLQWDAEQILASQLRLFAGYEVSKSAVLCYVATLGRGDYPAVPVRQEDVARITGVNEDAFEFAALKFAAGKVAEKARSGAVGYCLVPLSYETLADRRRREAYLRASAELPEDLRRFILPSIFNGPASPSTNFLMEIVGALRQSFPNIDWQTQSCAIDLDPLKHAGLFAATLTLPSGLHERRIEMARLPAFTRRLAGMRLRSGVAGLLSKAEIDEAVAARVQYLSGPAVSAEMPDLTPLVRLALGALPLAA